MNMLLIVAIKAVTATVALLTVFAGMTVVERKMLGYFQLRLGPNRTGPWGVLQPVADGIKVIFKEDIIPAQADKGLFIAAPIISLFVALAAFAVVPVGPPLHVGNLVIPMSVADPDGGLLVLMAFTSLGVYGLALGGWASQSKYALLGSLRSTAQMISYELAMGMSVVGVFVLAGSVRLTDIVTAQGHWWNVIPQFLGFVVFFICTLAETNRVPFDLPEAETELVSGFNTEYSGMRFAMFMMAEYINMVTMCSLTVLLYLGGWHGPFLPPVVWFLIKLAALLFVFIWIRATLPRLRYDKLMSFGWKVLLPLALLNLIGTAVVVAL